METVESWYMDEGGLVRTVCQNPKAIEDDPGEVLDECCACDEAKYEVTFEGLWSRNTHPKVRYAANFPLHSTNREYCAKRACLRTKLTQLMTVFPGFS